MRSCKEYRRIYNRLRARNAKLDRAKGRKPNGGAGWIDPPPKIECLFYNSKHAERHRNRCDTM